MLALTPSPLYKGIVTTCRLVKNDMKWNPRDVKQDGDSHLIGGTERLTKWRGLNGWNRFIIIMERNEFAVSTLKNFTLKCWYKQFV